MRIDILTLFPEMFSGPFGESIIKRAQERGLVTICLHNLREWGLGRHRVVDDYPYGGGPGMVMRPEPFFEAVEAIKAQLPPDTPPHFPTILLTPQGRVFRQALADEIALHRQILLLCGHYEGVDERVREHLATDEISIGDYVLTGGELAAMVVVDAVVRRLPGVLGSEAPYDDSHAAGLLEYPQYTRPPAYRGWDVPSVLLSGDHARLARWRREQALQRTMKRRPELLERARLSPEERRWLEGLTGD
ncbi:MAG: tRNA (guanosine(37)-N1)-methyltransferase TrmD [Chloroflexota bacterium]|nr:tRNA (guanosine(37)-N1)-methyltransferase TrmD [Chloroflexota bacterium]